MRSATAELLSRFGLWWLDHKPFSKEARARRQAKRAARKARRQNAPDEIHEPFFHEPTEVHMGQETVKITMPDGTTHERIEPLIKARTSTKVLGVGSAVVAATAAAVFPNWDAINAGLMAACQSEYGPAIGLGGMVVMLAVNVATARLTKSPAKPGAL